MSDENGTTFNVVDRRQAASEDIKDDIDRDPVDDEPAASDEPVTAQTAPEEAGSENQSVDHEETGYDKMPDPNFLIGMAAMQLSTPDFVRSLISAFDGMALRSIGLYADPRTGTSGKDLPSAQLAIDCIQFLYGKVEPSLSEDERKEAQRRLSFLRMNYIVQLKG